MDTTTNSKWKRSHSDYTIGWVCALPKEQVVAIAMLDERHPDLEKKSNDQNVYNLGSIGPHNIVIACLPKSLMGKVQAGTVVKDMARTFTEIKVCLLVGIGGGVPPKVRLGDVVVSIPVADVPAVIQWDYGKQTDGGRFKRTGSLHQPPKSVLVAISKLEAEHELAGSKIPEYLTEMGAKFPKLVDTYLKRETLPDQLFKASYSHVTKRPEMIGDMGEHEGSDLDGSETEED